MYSTLWILAKHLETTTATDGILLKQQYDYTGYILVFDKWFPLQDENSQELWFMHAWSETKEREMLTFTGNIKGQRSNCALQANCLPVPAICPYNRDEILIFCHFFSSVPSVETWRGSMILCAGHLTETIYLKKREQMKPWWPKCFQQSFTQFKSEYQRYSRSSARNLNFVLNTACESTSSPALLHFCIKG